MYLITKIFSADKSVVRSPEELGTLIFKRSISKSTTLDRLDTEAFEKLKQDRNEIDQQFKDQSKILFIRNNMIERDNKYVVEVTMLLDSKETYETRTRLMGVIGYPSLDELEFSEIGIAYEETERNV